MATRPVYLDCNATTPLEPRVRELMLQYFDHEYGNAGSRTHVYGSQAKKAVQRAREQVASVVDAKPDEVIFTSGATESNNLAILGLEQHARSTRRTHIVTTQIEHKAVLEPVAQLESRGFDVTYVPPTSGGWVEADTVLSAIRDDTALVSVMQANNETGVLQPISEIADGLADHPAYFHVDAAQGFGKEIDPLRNRSIDLISASAHKVYGPKGVGALIMRRRKFKRPPLTPLMWGGGQERGLRPGTIPVPLVAGFGLAAELGEREHNQRRTVNLRQRSAALAALKDVGAQPNGDQDRTMAHVLNVSLRGIDSEAAIVALKDVVAVSNGSACTSQDYHASTPCQGF
jgi:cysteine desulfurase